MPPESKANPALSRRLRLAAIVIVVAAAVVVAYGISTRMSGLSTLRENAESAAVPTVSVMVPGHAAASPTLELPGRIEAYARAPIYARVSGYLKSWQADIGTPVKAGQQLAVIETPDLDQQLLQARADLASAKANAALAGTTSKRWQGLLATDSVSRQEAEEKAGDYAAKEAMVNAAQANVDRYLAMKDFARIVAPFDGVVTARSTDVGALVNAGGGAGQELFEVSDTRKLRVYVSVPQSQTAQVHRGTRATVTVPERPGKTYAATVESLSQAVNAASGAMLVQLAVDNPQGELLPGGFANVSLALPSGDGALSIPPGALIFDKQGLHVATLDAHDRIVLKPVTIARDFGKYLEIATGLTASDRVVETPPDGIVDGEAVHVAARAPAGDASGSAARGTH